MTEDLQKQLEQANDMLQLVANQRNSAQNENVQLGAALTAANRKIEALEKRLAEGNTADKAPKSNGHTTIDAVAAA